MQGSIRFPLDRGVCLGDDFCVYMDMRQSTSPRHGIAE